MDFCNQHNLVAPENAGVERPFGIRVTMPTQDTFRSLLGENWEKLHWFPTEQERDNAFEHMAERHGYYRVSDNPSQILEKVAR